jgi:flagellar hook assembly protein FlgD
VVSYSNREEVVVDAEVAITDEVSLPTEFNLSQNYPNPFNAQTEIAFSLANSGEVTLEIYDIAGRLVKTLINDRLAKGRHVIIWDGANSWNDEVSTGIYFFKLSAGEKSTADNDFTEINIVSTFRIIL